MYRSGVISISGLNKILDFYNYFYGHRAHFSEKEIEGNLPRTVNGSLGNE